MCETLFDRKHFNISRKPCLFPFTYENRTYDKCATDIWIDQKPLCPTENQHGNWYEMQTFGICNCRYCETNITALTIYGK